MIVAGGLNFKMAAVLLCISCTLGRTLNLLPWLQIVCFTWFQTIFPINKELKEISSDYAIVPSLGKYTLSKCTEVNTRSVIYVDQ